MHISLVTEGTYPMGEGGVGVWCDQLITGLPEHTFEVSAIVATGNESLVWKLPPNVSDVSLIPLWGTPQHRRASRSDVSDFVLSFGGMLEALMTPGPGDTTLFLDAIKALLPFGKAGQLPQLLQAPAVIELLLDQWRLRPMPAQEESDGNTVPTPNLGDAVAAIGLLDHFLRPLSVPAPKADVCHSVSNGLGSLVAFNAKWTNNVPFLLTEHGVYLRERYLEYRASNYSFAVRALMLRFFRLLTAASYTAADFITPGSDYNRRWEVRNGAVADRVRPVYNGVDTTAFPDGGEPEQPTMSWAGRIVPIKDVKTLITAFGIVHKAIPEAKLRMFGSAPPGSEQYLVECHSLISELGLTTAATFEGRVEKIVDAYHAGNVVVLSSTSEGFPYTVIEAMASGRATVSTDVGGVREAVEDTGLIVPPRDPEAMAAACILLLTDDELRIRLANAARERTHQYFTLEQYLEIYRDIYPALASREYSQAALRISRPASTSGSIAALMDDDAAMEGDAA
jgi:glycosyltransferase involved in cell wall biosynthesis